MSRSQQESAAPKHTYAGLFLVSLATLMYELLLTRIFSVTMWYHFSFMTVSIVMFGMTVGAIVVYLAPDFFTPERVHRHLALSALLFAGTIVLSFLIHLRIPFVMEGSLRGLYSLSATYIVVAVPFVFSGICVCLALTRFPRDVGRLYGADLAGAALGCIALIVALDAMDGPRAVTLVALLAALGALLFTGSRTSVGFRRTVQICCLLLAVLALTEFVTAKSRDSLFRLVWVRGNRAQGTAVYEKWNSFSRIEIYGDPNGIEREPEGWGLSPVYEGGQGVRQLRMFIDSGAETFLTEFDGDLGRLEHLKYDVTNIAHYIRANADVLVIGPGGGRDVLAALAFEQKSITAVEINKAILQAVNGEFGEFTGHLDQLPNVRFINDEARSYIARQTDRFDILQISLIDTFAATMAGAFVLAENSLYTVEAWKIFLGRLTSDGVLTVSRWYFRDIPGAAYRMTSLARAALGELGVEDPRAHIIMVRSMVGPNPEASGVGIGTILLSRQPFTEEDLETIEDVAAAMEFDLVLTPSFSIDTTFAALASGSGDVRAGARLPIDVSAPTDDRPFFFNMLRFRDIFERELWAQGHMNFNLRAVTILALLLVIVAVLTLLCIVVPLFLSAGKKPLAGAFPLLGFFASIGFGFMLIEISQMQRLIVFLGHPTYALSVVLFTLLLASGLGSALTQPIDEAGLRGAGLKRLLMLLAALLLFGLFTPMAIERFQHVTTLARVLVAVGILFPLGLFMGMAFPLGMRVASASSASLTPWLWGINGATSVFASVLAVVIAMGWGISASFWTGFACYGAALVSFSRATRKGRG